MLAYVLSNLDLSLKDVLEFNDYTFIEDIDYTEKSKIIIAKKPNITDDDYVICKDENEVKFIGICETYSSSSDTGYTISLKQKETLFDRDIFLTNEGLIKSTGIEDFIVNQISSNWINSSDALLDKSYITASAKTHTTKNVLVELNNGVYNLKTFLGNAKELYHVYIEFDFSTADALKIYVSVKNETTLPIDIKVSDVSNYDEYYNVDVLAKLSVKWKVPDTKDAQGIITQIGATTYKYYYLQADRTITENKQSLTRVAGVQKSVYIETQNEADMVQQAQNAFTQNTYEHKITFNLIKDSALYPVDQFYVGRSCNIKTKTGIKPSMITKAEVSSSSPMITLTFGNLKITLIEKLRGQ